MTYYFRISITANHQHEWFYLSHMTQEEIEIFNIYDNHRLASIAHSALDSNTEETISTVRKSIESRTLVRY